MDYDERKRGILSVKAEVGLPFLVSCTWKRPACLLLQWPAEMKKHRWPTGSMSRGCAPCSEATGSSTAGATAASHSATLCPSEVCTSFKQRLQGPGPCPPIFHGPQHVQIFKQTFQACSLDKCEGTKHKRSEAVLPQTNAFTCWASVSLSVKWGE